MSAPVLSKYYPNNAGNPLLVGPDGVSAQAPSAEAPTAAPLEMKREVRFTNRMKAYRPMRALPAATQGNPEEWITDVEAFAHPRYIFGGTDLVYTKFDSKDFNNSHLCFAGGNTLMKARANQIDPNSPVGEIAVATSGASAARKGAILAVRAMPSTAEEQALDPANPANAQLISELASRTQLSLMTYDGSRWNDATMAEGAQTGAYLSPGVALDAATGNFALAYMKGAMHPSTLSDDATAQYLDGALYVGSLAAGATAASNVRKVLDLDERHALNGYGMASAAGKTVLLASQSTYDAQGKPVDGNRLSTMVLADGGTTASVKASDFRGIRPQVLALPDNTFAAFAIASGDGSRNGDINLYRIDADGNILSERSLGLSKRGTVDFRVVTPEVFTGLHGCALLWKEASLDAGEDGENVAHTAIYSSIISEDASHQVYISAPRAMAEYQAGAGSNTEIMGFDGFVKNYTVTAAITVADASTGGATIARSTMLHTNEFEVDNVAFDITHANDFDPVLNFNVINKGVNPISNLEIRVNGKATTKTVNLLPGASATVSAPGPWILARDPSYFTYEVKPEYVCDLGSTSSLGKVTAPGGSCVGGDMKVPMLSFGIGDVSCSYAKGKARFQAIVRNTGKFDVPDNVTVKAGIFKDPNGRTELGAIRTLTESTSLPGYLHTADAKGLVNLEADINESSTVYLVVFAIDESGNSAIMANSTYVPKTVIVDEAEGGVSDATAEGPTFSVSGRRGHFTVTGLSAGKTLRVFDLTGRLLKWVDVAGDESLTLNLPAAGVYMFTDGRTTLKR